jgi:putative transposase
MGFEEAIEAIFPKARVQSCVVHQVRNTINYVPYKNSKEIVADVKRIYKATTLKEAQQSLMDFSNKWREKYPRVVNSWNDNWHKLSTYFDYPAEIRKMIYTTNPIESLHSQFRKVTKTKRSFTNDDALLKLLYLVQKDITSKWALRPIHNWRSIRIQLLILFEDRFINDTLY